MFRKIETFLAAVPAITGKIGTGVNEDQTWWIKFTIDVTNNLAWHVVQEIGHVVNYVSIEEKLPTVFYPVSPPPYMNGGPEDFLSWIIESKDPKFSPDLLQEWLEGRMPRPVDDLEQWKL